MYGVKFWRRARGLTQVELSAASGVERAHLSRIETGVHEPLPHTLTRLADALDVNPIDLMVGPIGIPVDALTEPPASLGPLPPHTGLIDTTQETPHIPTVITQNERSAP